MPATTVTFEISNMSGDVLPGFSWELPFTDANYQEVAKNRLRTTHPNLPDAFSARVRNGDQILGFWSHDTEAEDNEN